MTSLTVRASTTLTSSPLRWRVRLSPVSSCNRTNRFILISLPPSINKQSSSAAFRIHLKRWLEHVHAECKSSANPDQTLGLYLLVFLSPQCAHFFNVDLYVLFGELGHDGLPAWIFQPDPIARNLIIVILSIFTYFCCKIFLLAENIRMFTLPVVPS